MRAQSGSRGTAVRFNFGARWRWVLRITPWPFYPRVRDEAPFVQETGWAPGPVSMGAENLVLT
jgi:hypothetical protein